MTPMLATLEPFDRAFFRGLNQLVEPLVRAGIGSPGIFPTGAVILSIPLLGTLLDDLAVVSTVRSGSQWIRNVAEHPQVRYWVLAVPGSDGRRRRPWTTRCPCSARSLAAPRTPSSSVRRNVRSPGSRLASASSPRSAAQTSSIPSPSAPMVRSARVHEA